MNELFIDITYVKLIVMLMMMIIIRQTDDLCINCLVVNIHNSFYHGAYTVMLIVDNDIAILIVMMIVMIIMVMMIVMFTIILSYLESIIIKNTTDKVEERD